MAAFLLAVLLQTSQPAGSLKAFRPAEPAQVPRTVIESEEICTTESCWEDFQQAGRAWQGDVNGDGVDELLVFPGSAWQGSGGLWYFLFHKRGEQWVPLAPDGWQTRGFRFRILPVVRRGYSDLCVDVDWCVKWDGSAYVSYEADDYHQLSAQLFDASDWREAEIFWAIRYAGRETFSFEPHWFPIPADWPLSSLSLELDDPEHQVRWIAVFKAGVWGVRESRAFLLLPQPTYTGAGHLELKGDWLLIYETREEPQPLARYNRRTGKLHIQEQE